MASVRRQFSAQVDLKALFIRCRLRADCGHKRDFGFLPYRIPTDTAANGLLKPKADTDSELNHCVLWVSTIQQANEPSDVTSGTKSAGMDALPTARFRPDSIFLPTQKVFI
jgi:hypothetical protein